MQLLTLGLVTESCAAYSSKCPRYFVGVRCGRVRFGACGVLSLSLRACRGAAWRRVEARAVGVVLERVQQHPFMTEQPPDSSQQPASQCPASPASNITATTSACASRRGATLSTATAGLSASSYHTSQRRYTYTVTCAVSPVRDTGDVGRVGWRPRAAGGGTYSGAD